MRYHTVLLAALTAAALAVPAGAGDFKVVIHTDNPTFSLPRDEVAGFFLRKTELWDHGAPAAPVDQTSRSEVREAFSLAIHDRPASKIVGYWLRVLFPGDMEPPPELASDAEVLDFVALDPGAIGYVAAGAPLPPAVKVLHVLGLPGGDPVAQSADRGFALASSDGKGDRGDSRDKTLSRHGDLRLFLTRACGPGDEGRYAVLENRDPDYAVRAEIESSVWVGERLRSSSVSHHTIDPLEEKRLGCTRRSGNTELRYAIVRASSATSHKLDYRPHRPARSVIAIVDSGSCGRGRAGRWRSVINRHTSRTVSVQVQVRELFDGKLRRSYRKNLRLSPGATRRLGCGADGKLTRQLAVLEADYR